MSGTVIAKVAGGGRYIAACCPFCVSVGKSPDTKYHLRVEKERYIYCYRCGFKKSYQWFIANYSLNLQGTVTPISGDRTTSVQATEFDIYIAQNTSHFSDSLYGKSAINYLSKRKISPELINWLDIRLGIHRMMGRVVFVDVANRYFMGRAIFPMIQPKTLNPTGNIRPLMYFDKFREDDLYIVEGVFDMIPMVKTNNNVCALLGKDIAQNQLKQLGESSATTILIALDSDAYADANKLAETIANHLPMKNIGICSYKNKNDTRKDPADYDLDFFDNVDIVWTRMMRMTR